MRQTAPFAKLVSAVLFAAVCAYLLANLARFIQDGSCEVLTEKTVTDSIGLEGIALRFEQTVCLEGEPMLFCKSGERVAAEEVFAQCGGEMIKSKSSALFFDSCDGYEYLTVTEDGFSPERLDGLLSAEKREEKTAGRLVTGRSWYFAAYADTKELPRGEYRIRFECFDEKISGSVVCSIPDGQGRTAVLIRLPIGKNEYLSLRRCRGEIIGNEYTGLKVPTGAVTEEDGNNFVIRLTVTGEKPFPVDILYKSKDFFLIRPTDELFAGAKVKMRNSECGIRN